MCAAGALFFAWRTQALNSQRARVTINGYVINAEVVASETARARGLGGREGIGADEGMLFIFDDPGFHSIWMKDMHFPIDIVWIGGGKIVGIEENVDPQIGAADSALRTYRAKLLDDFVLELPAGRLRALGARMGDAVSIVRDR